MKQTEQLPVRITYSDFDVYPYTCGTCGTDLCKHGQCRVCTDCHECDHTKNAGHS